MSNTKGRREAFDDVVIIVNQPVESTVIEVAPHLDELVGTFELGDIEEFQEISPESGLGDINDPDFGGHLGMILRNSKS